MSRRDETWRLFPPDLPANEETEAMAAISEGEDRLDPDFLRDMIGNILGKDFVENAAANALKECAAGNMALSEALSEEAARQAAAEAQARPGGTEVANGQV